MIGAVLFRKKSLSKIVVILLAAVVLLPVVGVAQVESDERPLTVDEDGIGFRKDSVFLMNLRFRMQNRLASYSIMESEERPGVEAVVRRLRLRFDGYVLHPRIGYYIQLSFSRADQDLVSGDIAQVVRDAMVYYTFSKRFYIGFGQSKLPGNRERVISSGNLQLPDRSIANQAFTLDRDFGLFAYYTLLNSSNQIVLLKAAFTSGEGRGQTITPYGMSYTGRIEWLPMGRFKNLGDYSEGDLEYEPTPKLSLAYTYNFNDRTTRSGGQLGAYLPLPVDMTTQIADLMLKYRGWGLMAEYFNRRLGGYTPDGVNDLTMNRIARGSGFNVQLSKVLHRKHEVVLRYAGVTPQKGYEAFQYRYRTRGLGYNYYLNKHRVKLQYYLGFDDRTHPQTVPELKHLYRNRMVNMVQVELGI
jgi:hypothetical protein